MSNEDEQQMIRGLEALANVDESAPPGVRVRLGLEFRRRLYPAGQTARRLVRWLMAAAAVLVLMLSAPPSRKRVPATIQSGGDLSSFIRLDSEPVTAGVVVRVKLPRAVLFDDGVPGEVEAEVLLGDDGLAHAVRLIRQ